MKKLFLHIGHYKTGTSAIQKYCNDHAEELAENGLYYSPEARPQNNKTNHGQLSLSLAHEHGFHPPPWYVERRAPDEVFAEFLEDVDKRGLDKILVSSEEFFQLGLRENPTAAIEDLKRRLEGFDVRIIMYIREPMSLLKSWFSQLNKGAQGTRTFPVVFQNLDPNFLSQLRPHEYFAQVFGVDQITVRSYVQRGMAHIEEFLSLMGLAPLGDDEELVVNSAIPIKKIETKRINKRQDLDFDAVTLSQINGLGKLLRKTDKINRDFELIMAKSNLPLTSDLSVLNVFRYHDELTRPLIESGGVNDKEAVILRDIAYEAESHDLELAQQLMRTAQMIRPNGAIIRRKLKNYETLLANGAASTDATGPT